MKVKTNQLQIGCILSNDLISPSNQVLIRKKTIVNEEILDVIQAFLIDSVDVESTLITGEPFTPKEVIKEEKQHKSKNFMELYLDAVKVYKKMFQGWQSGLKVDILKIREIVLPIIEKLDEQPNEINSFHLYATKEEYIYHHAISVGVLSAFIGRKLKYSKGEEIQLGIAGVMADSGMSKIENRLLWKKEALTAAEYDEIKKHPLYSYHMLKETPGVSEGVLLAVLQHHEREDGSGYPMNVKSEKMHKLSKVIGVVDVFLAMSSERFYKSRQSPYKVIEMIMKDNFGKFDINVVQTLCSHVTNFSIGTKVRLNSEEIGEIIYLELHAPTRPMIKLDGSGEFIKLVNRNDLYIEEVLG